MPLDKDWVLSTLGWTHLPDWVGGLEGPRPILVVFFSKPMRQIYPISVPKSCRGDTALPDPSASAEPRPSAPRGPSPRRTVMCFCFISRQASRRAIFAALGENKPLSVPFTAFWRRAPHCQPRCRGSILKFKEMPPFLSLFQPKA